ncbi:MAG: PSD1 and planctomycete cytochrome C domain-containing protein [Roseimicrobium sp.]
MNLRPLFFLATLAAAPAWGATSVSDDTKIEFFEKKIRPILADHCYQCHSADTKPAGLLRVDDRNGLLVGGEEGPAIVVGDPDQSLILQRILTTDEKKHMPKEGEPLTDEEIADLKTWIKDGAAWTRERIPPNLGKTRPDYEILKAKHWAWQPVKSPSVPEVKDKAWPQSKVDRFILAKLEEKKLRPVADADPVTLIRRVTFDLTGLPPTPAEVEEFVQDPSDKAFAKVVDRLLQSQGYGERWGRHWLDIARYGESTGPSRNIPYPHAWKYRDYVLDAVQRDVPFHRFVQEQIAGDLLPASGKEERDRLLTATGFLALGVKDVNQRFKTRFIMDNVDEQIDAVTRSVLAVSVSCARCHDHKFDPVPTTDYYALAGIFTSTDDCAGVRNKMGGGGLDYYDPKALVLLSSDLPAPPAEKVKQLETDLAAAKKVWDEIRGTPEGVKKGPDGFPHQRQFRLKFEALQTELQALTDPAAQGYAVHGVREAKVIADTEVRIRGEAERIGPTVPRGFLTAFRVPDAPKVNDKQSGRLELAQWLTSQQNPLTSRVIVNRVWAHLFGQGIVSTVDNFGVKGDVPSHPELLDYLATQFVREGWSVKQLIKTLVLSRSYRLGTEAPLSLKEADPANRLVWRHSPRRLDAEEIRDAILVAANRLESRMPGASAVNKLKMIEMRDNGAEAKSIHDAADASTSRSVYLPLLRGVIPKSLEAFDPVTQSLVTGQRDSTTVPTQSLYFLNGTFVRQQALAVAKEVLASDHRSEREWITVLYQRSLGRKPTRTELERSAAFIEEYAASVTPVARPKPELVLAVAKEKPQEPAPGIAANPDDIERGGETDREARVEASDAQSAAWAAFAQALFASAEFRFVR